MLNRSWVWLWSGIMACGLLLIAQPAFAQKWANDMFQKTDYDFGTVAKNAEVNYRFELTNIYKENLVIRGVRSSCGCTTPTLSQNVINSRESGYVNAKFNTDRFVGSRSAIITVMIDKPYPAEVQLRVKGVIRNDVVIEPGFWNFGTIADGTETRKTLQIDYRGRMPNWEIVDVLSAYDKVRISKKQIRRQPGFVSYNLTARLLPGVETGVNQAELILVTNDPSNRQIPVTLAANVISAVQVLPASLDLGDLEPGQRVTKQVLVRSQAGCSIAGVECECPEVQTEVPQGENKIHRIPVTFIAGDQAGPISSKIRVTTADGTVRDVRLTANVVVR